MSYRHKGIDGAPWKDCDRCGFEYPMAAIRRQRGMWLCIEHCFDDLAYDRAKVRLSEKVSPALEGEDKFQWVPDNDFEV